MVLVRPKVQANRSSRNESFVPFKIPVVNMRHVLEYPEIFEFGEAEYKSAVGGWLDCFGGSTTSETTVVANDLSFFKSGAERERRLQPDPTASRFHRDAPGNAGDQRRGELRHEGDGDGDRGTRRQIPSQRASVVPQGLSRDSWSRNVPAGCVDSSHFLFKESLPPTTGENVPVSQRIWSRRVHLRHYQDSLVD